MTPLDSRTWLVWGICSMVPLLVARHPLLMLQMLAVVIVVRVVCVPPRLVRWGWIIRIAVVFAIIGVLLNALTVRSGNQVAFTLPGFDWVITWNAIAYGVVSGMAMVCLVLVGTTTAAGLDWIALTRVLPQRFAPLAVSGSVAWSFLPSASQAITDIREAQAARGHKIRSGRDTLPIMIPLLEGSLNRALTMSEALEARGFGATAGHHDSSPRTFWFGGMGVLTGSVLLAYALSLGSNRLLWPSAVMIGVSAVLMWHAPGSRERTTRYREHRLRRHDTLVMALALGGLVAFLILFFRDGSGVVFNPYPNLKVPGISISYLLALVPFLGPALYPYREATP